MKNLLLLIIVLGAAYTGYQKLSVPAKTGVPAFSETRFVLNFGSRDIEMVGFTKRDSSESCDLAKTWMAESVLGCSVVENCSVKEFSCRDTIPERYLDMFDEHEATTTYMKASNPVNAREAVVLNWGLTQAEAMEICQFIKKKTIQLASKSGQQVSAACY